MITKIKQLIAKYEDLSNSNHVFNDAMFNKQIILLVMEYLRGNL